LNGRTWTPDDTATLRRMAQAGYSDGEIASHLNFARETVTRRRLCLGYAASLKLGWRRRLVRDVRIAA
jgi:orotate phosphoribosyltransferase-like protein